jgi:hypothetical protein
MITRLALNASQNVVEMQRSAISDSLDRPNSSVGRCLGKQFNTVDGKLAKNMSSGLGILVNSVGNRVGNVITGLMVASILLKTSSCEETTDRLLKDLEEGNIVGSTGETSGSDLDILGLEVLTEEIFDNIRTRRPTGTLLLAGAVEDTEETARNHVEVEVSEEVVNFVLLQVVDVVARSDKTVLFSSPPSESDLQLVREVLQSLGVLKNERCAGS